MTPRQLKPELAKLQAANLLRRRLVLSSPQGAVITIDGQKFINFSSNDYLGLAANPAISDAFCAEIQKHGAGSGASHLVCGHFAEHEKLEYAIAQFTGAQSALVFSSGFMANLGVVSALADGNTAILADKLNHASLLDGARLAGAQLLRFSHLDMQKLKALAQKYNATDKMIVSDVIFSMDGDIADIKTLADIAAKHGAFLLLDEAHSFGISGKNGRGLGAALVADNPNILLTVTFGKALGVYGAAVAGSETVIEWLKQKARTYIYTTALPPAIAAATLKALEIVQKSEKRREKLKKLITYFHEKFSTVADYKISRNPTPIQTIIVGDNKKALELEKKLYLAGILAKAIRPPTVPPGTARIRISITSAHTESDIDLLARVFLT